MSSSPVESICEKGNDSGQSSRELEQFEKGVKGAIAQGL